jgi:hypothetical protein
LGGIVIHKIIVDIITKGLIRKTFLSIYDNEQEAFFNQSWWRWLVKHERSLLRNRSKLLKSNERKWVREFSGVTNFQ